MGIYNSMPGPQQPLSLTQGLQSKFLNVLQVDWKIPGLVPGLFLCLQSTQCIHRICRHVVQIHSLSTSQSCHHQLELSWNDWKGMYAWVRPHGYLDLHYRNTVANVDVSDSGHSSIFMIIARDLRLMVSQLYWMAVTQPRSCDARITIKFLVSPKWCWLTTKFLPFPHGDITCQLNLYKP